MTPNIMQPAMRIGNYTFRPSLFATMLVLVSVILFTRLAFWQWHRAEEKQAIAATITAHNALAPLALPGASIDVDKQRYRGVAMTGIFEAGDEVLLDNVVHKGKAGYHVITPLRIAGSDRRILVNRGWIPVGRDRRILPKTGAPTGLQQIEGMLDKPRSRPVLLGKDQAPNPEGTRRLTYIDPDWIARQAGYPVEPFVVLQTSDTPDPLRRDWPAYDGKVGMHIGYCIQWASFAVISLIIYLVMNTRKHQQTGAA